MQAQGLYRPEYEHDACGVGFVAHIKGRRSHRIVSQGLEVLKNLTHRGAVGADPLQGDGAGILIQLPDQIYRDDLLRSGVRLPPEGEYGVGMVFLPREEASRHACQEEIERAVRAEGQIVLGWRNVPVNRDLPMSPQVTANEPVIRQIFVAHSPDVLVTDALERKLYLIRKRSSIAIARLQLKHCTEFYIPSFSARTVVYKGQLLAAQVGQYYKDLGDSRCVSALALIHQRFSTNTFPRWSLAHPFRMIAHNGEINTLRGNFNWIRAREQQISSPVFGADLPKLWPLIFQGQSDSASFDNVFELLTMSGYSPAQAAMMMIPAAWDKDPLLEPKLRAFYEFHAAMMEPWDGPAAVAFTDGRQIGATLDRNGLRPARYLITKDQLVIMASEEGVLDLQESRIARRWRVEPGHMLLVDTEQGRIIDDAEIKNTLAAARPYAEWVKKVRIRLCDLQAAPAAVRYDLSPLMLMRVFGYTDEDVERILKPMAVTGSEPTVSMGNDTPLAVLSSRLRPLYDYFRQLFAQVTNPPIDPLREALVTSLISFVGPRPNLLNIMDTNPPVRLEISRPLLTDAEAEQIRHIDLFTEHKFRARELDCTYPLSWGAAGIEARLASIRAAAVDAVRSGVNILILTDRLVSAARVAIPALLATSAVHQCLVEQGLRTGTGLVVETGSAFSIHHFALLAGYGAEAVHPYAALQAVALFAHDERERREYLDRYLAAVDKGLYKTMARMGICTYMSYVGAQIFETVGLNADFLQRYFAHTPGAVGGVGLFDIAAAAVATHRQAFLMETLQQPLLERGGRLGWRHDGDTHSWSPEAVVALQRAVREDSFADYRRFAELCRDHDGRARTLRGLLDFTPGTPVPLAEVEDEEQIIRRFATAAMSMGAISTEAHVCMAVAMNRLQASSNSGEGGEDPRRDLPVTAATDTRRVLGDDVAVAMPLEAGDRLNSRTRQVASGRFGVTAGYLARADMLQIKMAQGAKPGEGGQLPGHKVSAYIGRLRHSLPGIGLISPPPHHDIYSIEDLAQLIHDLKLANPRAAISVKLVSEVGIGTVAAGVAKCKADHLVISGHDGGTGAAPASSVMHAGSAWEIGLAEAQQTLEINRLRSRIRLQVDGQIKTGRDVVIAGLLGADECGFGTAALVCLGCTLMRQCHRNTCPAGIATQDPRLRARFAGRPEHLMRYFRFVAREVRELMAALGYRRFADLIGHSERLRATAAADPARRPDFSRILFRPEPAPVAGGFGQTEEQDHGINRAFDQKVRPQAEQALRIGTPLRAALAVANTDRSIGTLLSGICAVRSEPLPDDFIRLRLTGTAGQSCGAFLTAGITLDLVGQANDYVGKGLSGGRIFIRPSPDFTGTDEPQLIAGNTCLYGATSGLVCLAGVCGERFAVRNSGARAVCEGVGDHGCEYMTGGTVVILGPVGRNFGAGMSGGVAYIYDPDRRVRAHLAAGNFRLDQLSPQGAADKTLPLHDGRADADTLHELLEIHRRGTDSRLAAALLAQWPQALAGFVKVWAVEYVNALSALQEGK